MNSFKSLRYSRAFLCVLGFLLISLSSNFSAHGQSKNKPAANNAQVVSLADFGAIGDGVADDGPAFKSALDALAESGGGTLLVPAGHYFIGSPVTKDFSGTNASVTIQGIPSDTMPAPPTAGGDQLSRSLDLTSEIIPATGSVDSAFTLSNLHDLTIEHLGFTGRGSERTDAFNTIYLFDVTHATIHHCEFYAISTLVGGNVIRAIRTDLSIDQSSVLGCTANSGAYAPIVENIEWKGFSISNSIFLDYGQRVLFSKMGLGSPLSWINFGPSAAKTADSSQRQIVIRETFLDEGGWIGITAYPHRWNPPVQLDLLYISGLKMNVSNFGTAGHQFFDVKKVLIENSHYGWSHFTSAAIDINRSEHAILDQLTGEAAADRVRADGGTGRLTVLNSDFEAVDSLAQTTTILETAPEDDPVQYVRQQFLSVLGRQPDPASHFYWSDLLLRCGEDQNCRDATRTDLNNYLTKQPDPNFALIGTVTDEDGNPISGAMLNLSGSQSLTTLTDTDGKFRFSGLQTSGVYNVTASKLHYNFPINNQAIVNPPRDVSVSFGGRLNRHSVGGRITKADGTGASGVKVQLSESSLFAMTDANGEFSFANLIEGETYTLVPQSDIAAFLPAATTIADLAANSNANFAMKLLPRLLNAEDSQNALVLNSVNFVKEPFSVFETLGFTPDGINRVMLFAMNLEGVNDLSQFSVLAQDSEGQTYPLAVEFVGDVPEQSWVKQVNVKLSPGLSGKCVDLKLSFGTLNSNSVRLCLANN